MLDTPVEHVLWCTYCLKQPAEGELGMETSAGSNEFIEVPVCADCGQKAVDDPTLSWVDQARA